MSYRLYFDVSTGLKADMVVPEGTLASIQKHIEIMERRLGLVRVPNYVPEGKDPSGGWRWRNARKDMLAFAGEEVPYSERDGHLRNREREDRINEMHMLVNNGHDHFIERLYEDLGKWAEGKGLGDKTEILTAAESRLWMPVLCRISWPDELMTRYVFGEYLRHVAAVLAGQESRGIQLSDCEPLSDKQQAELLVFIEGLTDVHGYDLRAAQPVDEDGQPVGDVAFSYDGGYDWCGGCGLPIHAEYVERRCHACPNRKSGQCDLADERGINLEPEEDEA